MPKLQLVPRSNPRTLDDALQDFYLSKRSALAVHRTLEYYERVLGEFYRWLGNHQVDEPEQLTSRCVRARIASIQGSGLADATVHLHAQGVKAFVRFLLREGYVQKPITFDMPRPARIRTRLPSVEEVRLLLATCESPSDRALLLVLADTGSRIREVTALTWGDVDLKNGGVHIVRGKGRNARSIVVGVRTRKSLLKYRRTVPHEPEDPVWVGRGREPMQREGIRQIVRRLSIKTRIEVSCHDFRRFFATSSLRAGMNPLHVQALLGHTSISMTMRYIQLVESDLQAAHAEHGPVDRFLR